MLSKTQKEAIEKLVAVGGLEHEVDWAALGLRKGTVKALINSGYLVGQVDRRYMSHRISPMVKVTEQGATAEVKPEAETATCQCCFRSIVVKGGIIVKHGWQEAGGRKQGQYGNAWHVGSCPGSVYAPFEVSCERTKWYVAELNQMRTDKQESVAKAMDPARRPAKLSYEVKVRIPNTWVSETKILWVEDDGVELAMEEQGYLHYNEAPKYTDLLRIHVRRLQREIGMLDLDIVDLEKRIAEWKKES